jgi:hypothetical protein
MIAAREDARGNVILNTTSTCSVRRLGDDDRGPHVTSSEVVER